MLLLTLNSKRYSSACVDLQTWRDAWVVKRKIVDYVLRQTLRGSLKAVYNTSCALSMRLTASVVTGGCTHLQQVLRCHFACQTCVACGAGNYMNMSKGAFVDIVLRCSDFQCCFTE